ncbi:S8 family serine peptidase [Eubacterium aggregans]|uniref:S8 family serine peptidase n=1 Tax=Eubacterium aggregans TaxID=81409 RepID=UPI003F381151
MAICDTGLDVGHPDLKNVVMTDIDAYNTEGGQHGINISGDGDVTDVQDRDDHGTHVAGIIASEWNDFGTSGVASGVKLASVKLTQPNGEVSMAQAVKAYTYLGKAMDNGLNLVAVNNSWGDRQMSKVLSTVVTELGEKGAIFIFSSGNNNTDSDMNPTSPLVLKNNPYSIVVNS